MPFTIYWPRADGPFVLIPYGMRPGQAPEDIAPALRNDWMPLVDGHPCVPRDVMWSPGTFDVVDADPQPALALNRSLYRDQMLADARADLAEEIAVARAIVALADSLNKVRPGPLPHSAPSQPDFF